MKNKTIKIMCLFMSILMIIPIINIMSVSAAQDSKIETLIAIAKQEVGYTETTYDDGTFSSKYGDWYGLPKGAWCAMFVSWCANQAGISTNAIPKFASCATGREWFQSKNLWKNKGEYIPQQGDLVFLNDCSHVGIVEKFDDDIVYTIEGNAADENGVNFGVRQHQYAITSSKITGFGTPDLAILNKFNGTANQKAPAYMMPDSSSNTVWEVWQNDELEVLCQDGNYYLVMYPFLSTGKFVCAYVKKDVVNLTGTVPEASEFYNINTQAITSTQVNLYHNASNQALMSNSGVDKKVRAILPANSTVNVLFKRDNYYFVEYNNTTGYVDCNEITIVQSTTENVLSSGVIGDVDNDGTVSILDVTKLQRFISSIIDLDDNHKLLADVNGDKRNNICDVTKIQLFLAGIITKFPVEDTIANTTSITFSSSCSSEVTSIEVYNSNTVYLGESKTIGYKVLPENVTDKTIYWISSDDDIVTVDSNGVMTGSSLGTAKITAISKNGVRSTFSVTVNKKVIDSESIAIDNTNPEVLNNGQAFQLNATVYPAETTDKTVMWTSSNPDIASVNENGLVTANNAGVATITAGTKNNKMSTATIKVNKTTNYIENGTYCLKLKNTNSYLDHQGGNTNGTNIHLWEGDGNSNANQKIVVDRLDDNRIMLRSAVNNKLLVDLNRGSSYSDPIEIGKNIDLWENNDYQAQEWLFTKTYDGYYIIRLNTLQNGAIEAGGTSNGSNIYLGTYNSNNDMQKWELVNSSAYVVPEKTAWVCNTADTGNVNVRSGPGTGYNSIGGFNEGQQITVIGDLSGDWYKVRGANRHDGNTIEGYCYKDYITFNYNPPVSKFTNQDGANWALNHVGQWIDTDHSYGAQCKDFVNAYTQENFGVTLPGNACALIYDNLPSGWQRIQNYAAFVPEPGDIAIWGAWNGNQYGHTAVIVSANVNTFVSVDQNWVNSSSNGSAAAKVTHNYTNPKFWGVIRPNFDK